MGTVSANFVWKSFCLFQRGSLRKRVFQMPAPLNSHNNLWAQRPCHLLTTRVIVNSLKSNVVWTCPSLNGKSLKNLAALSKALSVFKNCPAPFNVCLSSLQYTTKHKEIVPPWWTWGNRPWYMYLVLILQECLTCCASVSGQLWTFPHISLVAFAFLVIA